MVVNIYPVGFQQGASSPYKELALLTPFNPIHDLTVYWERHGYYGVYSGQLQDSGTNLTTVYPLSYLTPYAPYKLRPNSQTQYYSAIFRRHDRLIIEVSNFRGWERWRINAAKLKEIGLSRFKVYCPVRIVDDDPVLFTETDPTTAQIALQFNLPLWTAYIYEANNNPYYRYTVVVPDSFGYVYKSYPPDVSLSDLLFYVGGVQFVRFTLSYAGAVTQPLNWGTFVGTAKVVTPAILRAISSVDYYADTYRHMLPSEAPDLNLPPPMTSDTKLLHEVGELVDRQLNTDYDRNRVVYWSPSATEFVTYQPSTIVKGWQLVIGNVNGNLFAPKFAELSSLWDYRLAFPVITDKIAVQRYVYDRQAGQIDLYNIPYVLYFSPTPLSGDTRKQVINLLRPYCKHLAEISPRYLVAVFNDSAFEEREETVRFSVPLAGMSRYIPVKVHRLLPVSALAALLRCYIVELNATSDCPPLRMTINDLPEALVLKFLDCADWRQNYSIVNLPVAGRIEIAYSPPPIIRHKYEAIVVRGNPIVLRRPIFTNPQIQGWLAACYLNEGCYILSYSGNSGYGEYFALTGRGLFYVAEAWWITFAISGFEFFGTAFWRNLALNQRLNYTQAMLRWGWNGFLNYWTAASSVPTHYAGNMFHKGLTVGRFYSPTLVRLYGDAFDPSFSWHPSAYNPDVLWRLVHCKVNLADTLPEPYRTGYKVLFGELSGAFIYFGNGTAEAFAPIWLGYDFENYRNRWAVAFWRVNSYDPETDTILDVLPYPEIVNLEFKPTT